MGLGSPILVDYFANNLCYFFSCGVFNTFKKKYPVKKMMTAQEEQIVINAAVDIKILL